MPINNIDNFNELVSKYHSNPDGFAFFVGAGLSRPLFPSWASLLIEMINKADKAGLAFEKEELIEFVNKGEQFLDVAETCVNSLGATSYRNFMEEAFDKNFSLDDIPPAYLALLELANKTIITTNYDRIPEVGGQGKYRIGTNKNIPEMNRSIAKGDMVALKIHGDINDQSSIVLTSNDYQEIIHKNPSVKTMLTSLLNTKVFIFIGFSLSDPHINLILDSLKTINNGMPISHYAVISETSKFKLSAFQKKYGLNVIDYSPSDSTHSEIVELLRALNNRVSTVEIKQEESPQTISSDDELINHLSKQIESITGHGSFFVWLENQTLNIGFNSIGETISEMQREILSICKLFNFKSDLFSRINILVGKVTPPRIEFNMASPVILKIECDKQQAINYSNKKIVSNVFWENLTLQSVPNIGDPFGELSPVKIPLNAGILGS